MIEKIVDTMRMVACVLMLIALVQFVQQVFQESKLLFDLSDPLHIWIGVLAIGSEFIKWVNEKLKTQ